MDWRLSRSMLPGFVAGLVLSSLFPTSAHGQDDAPLLRAIMEELRTMQSREDFPAGFLIREGFFQLSRDDIRRNFGEPLREWTRAERNAIAAVAEEMDFAMRLCRSDCQREDTEWLVSLGAPEHTSQPIAVVALQIDGSNDSKSSWLTAYAFTLARRPRDRWSVIDVWPGMSSHAEERDGN